MGSLIELAVVALFDMPLAKARAEQLSLAMSKFADQALLPSWYDYLALLTGDIAQLEGYFSDLAAWSESLVGQDIAWGQLYLDVLAACRLIDARPEVQSRFTEQLNGAAVERILAAETPYPLARQAVAGLRHLLGHQQARPFRNATPVWEQWLSGLTQLADKQQSPSQSPHRLVWQLTQRRSHVIAKIQKRGKKGWSKGRQVQIDDLGYKYAEILSDGDQGVIGAIQNHHGRAWRDWRPETELNVPLLRALVKCDNIVDDSGSDLTLYAEKPLVVLSAEEERLVLSSYPAQDKVLLYPKAANALAFLDISDQVSAFLAAVKEYPQSLPVAACEQVESTLAQFSKLDWYSELNQQGSVSLGQWETQPQLWLDWQDGVLGVSIEHQPAQLDPGESACLSYPSGKGPQWVPQGVASPVWYRRDLKQEQASSLTLLKALGLKANAGRHWQLVGEHAQALIQALSEVEAAVHWRAKSRQLSVVGTQDFRLEVEQQQDWFALDGKVTVDKDLELNLRTLLSHHRAGFITLANDGVTVMLSETLQQQLRVLESLLNDEQQVDRRMAYPLQQLIAAFNHQGDTGWEALVEQWREKPVLAAPLLAPLRDYQKESVIWAAHLAHHGFGACLADDMGLGKTLQALTLIRHFGIQGPSLVVAPKSVLSNWQQEARRFAPELTVIDVESAADRVAAIEQAGAQTVVLLSYGLLTRLETVLHEKTWQCAVLDEAQQIKNPNAKRSKIAFGLQAQCRFALSGTPVENHLLELWSLFSFLNPGLLGNRQQFKQKYANAANSEEDMLRLRALVSPFIMRRLKQTVLTELPAKTEITHTIELSKPERTAYEAVRKESVAVAQSGKGLVEVLACLTRLRQVCCDPRLVFSEMNSSGSKLNEALQLVNEAREGQHRILVFSQFVTLLKMFASQLDAASVDYSYLDGKSSSRQRKQAIEAFTLGRKDVFLISLKAGGTGLNLTQADTVIHLDPWWNPAVEDQASDRAYRMGQTKPVTVYRLVAANTIEEKIVRLHQDKRDLADKVLSGQDSNQSLSPELLLTLMDEGEG